MFGIPGPGPKQDRKPIPSDKKKEKGIMMNEIGDSSAKPFKWSSNMKVRTWLFDNALLTKGKQHSGSYDDRYHKTEIPFEYKFASDTTGTKYHVRIGGYFGKNLWLPFSGNKPKNWKPYHCILGVGFGVDGIDGDPETNLNEQFRVMATVVECTLDFIQKVLDDDDQVGISEFHMNPKLDKEEQKGMDSRRGKLYLAYIRNSFKKLNTSKQYRIEQNKDGFVLKFGESRMGGTGKIPDNVIAATYENTQEKTNNRMKNLPSIESFITESVVNEATAIDKTQPFARDFIKAVEAEFKTDVKDSQIFKMVKGFEIRVAIKANEKMYDWAANYTKDHKDDLKGVPLSFRISPEIPGKDAFWPADNKKFFDVIEESVVNEAKGPDLKDVQRLQKEFEKKTKFINNMKGMDWRSATEPIIVTNKDLDLKGSASGNYMITAAYQMYGPVFKVEYVAVEQNPKFPKTLGVWTKTLDEQVWNKFVHAHDKQLLPASRLDANAIKILSPMVAQFVTDELNAYFGANTQNADTSLKGLITDTFKDSEVSEISGNRLRVDFYVPRAGDGKAVGKTNLLFIVSPEHQTIEFKNPDSRNPVQDTYTDFKGLSQYIKNTIRDWKAADREKYEEWKYNQWKSEQ